MPQRERSFVQFHAETKASRNRFLQNRGILYTPTRGSPTPMTLPSSQPARELPPALEAVAAPDCDVEAVMHRVGETLERILAKLNSYRLQADIELVRRAFLFAKEKHAAQKRKGGEPYIVHPVDVTEVLADLEMDEQTLAAALLHDVIEDCEVTLEELDQLFGSEVANLVDGVTKLQIKGVDEGKDRDE